MFTRAAIGATSHIFGEGTALAGVAAWIDRCIIAGVLVRGLHGTTELVGRALRLAPAGNLQTYSFFLAAGVAILLFYMFIP